MRVSFSSVTTSLDRRVSISDRRVSLVSLNASKARAKSSKAEETSSEIDLVSTTGIMFINRFRSKKKPVSRRASVESEMCHLANGTPRGPGDGGAGYGSNGTTDNR